MAMQRQRILSAWALLFTTILVLPYACKSADKKNDQDKKDEEGTGIRKALSGYDIMKGNPLSMDGHVDPGWRHQIFVHPDDPSAEDNPITVQPGQACESTTEHELVNSLRDYKQRQLDTLFVGSRLQIGYDMDVTVGIGDEATGHASVTARVPPLFSAGTSVTNDKSTAREFFQKREGGMVASKAECEIHKVFIENNVIPKFTQWFKASVTVLWNTIKNESENSTEISKEKFRQFIRNYGTHYSRETSVGGRISRQVTFTKEEKRHFTEDQATKCSESYVSAAAFSVQATTEVKDCSMKDESNNNGDIKNAGTARFSTYGSKSFKDMNAWTQQDFDSPLPLTTDLVPIIRLFTEENLKQIIEGLTTSDYTKFISRVREHYKHVCPIMHGETKCKSQVKGGCGINVSCKWNEDCVGGLCVHSAANDGSKFFSTSHFVYYIDYDNLLVTTYDKNEKYCSSRGMKMVTFEGLERTNKLWDQEVKHLVKVIDNIKNSRRFGRILEEASLRDNSFERNRTKGLQVYLGYKFDDALEFTEETAKDMKNYMYGSEKAFNTDVDRLFFKKKDPQRCVVLTNTTSLTWGLYRLSNWYCDVENDLTQSVIPFCRSTEDKRTKVLPRSPAGFFYYLDYDMGGKTYDENEQFCNNMTGDWEMVWFGNSSISPEVVKKEKDYLIDQVAQRALLMGIKDDGSPELAIYLGYRYIKGTIGYTYKNHTTFCDEDRCGQKETDEQARMRQLNNSQNTACMTINYVPFNETWSNPVKDSVDCQTRYTPACRSANGLFRKNNE